MSGQAGGWKSFAFSVAPAIAAPVGSMIVPVRAPSDGQFGRVRWGRASQTKQKTNFRMIAVEPCAIQALLHSFSRILSFSGLQNRHFLRGVVRRILCAVFAGVFGEIGVSVVVFLWTKRGELCGQTWKAKMRLETAADFLHGFPDLFGAGKWGSEAAIEAAAFGVRAPERDKAFEPAPLFCRR